MMANLTYSHTLPWPGLSDDWSAYGTLRPARRSGKKQLAVVKVQASDEDQMEAYHDVLFRYLVRQSGNRSIAEEMGSTG